MAALRAFAPADEIEAMLASLVIGAHAAAQEALRRAAHPTGESVGEMWTRAAELGRLSLDTMGALERRRAARQEAPDAGAAENRALAAAPSSTETRPVPPVPPMSPKTISTAPKTSLDKPLSNEELHKLGGYRTPPAARHGVEAEASVPAGLADPNSMDVEAELRTFGYGADPRPLP